MKPYYDRKNCISSKLVEFDEDGEILNEKGTEMYGI